MDKLIFDIFVYKWKKSNYFILLKKSFKNIFYINDKIKLMRNSLDYIIIFIST